MHRDVKPLNILIKQTGEIKLCDFGESRLLENSLATTHVGTVAYLAPERMSMQRLPKYDVRADVWSLGLALIEVVHGRIPWIDELGDEYTGGNAIVLQAYISNIDGDYLAKKYIKANYSFFARNFITQCLRDYEKRPKYEALKESMFYKMYSLMGKEDVAKLFKTYVVS
jgi:mitogen-activated protein kinase kinase 5